ncbi:MAG: hypothetical protein KDA32_09025 [Phycisphaerales bacterium]|nr:hypothetical protein [Phycisphaerales bacterium]
MAGVIRKDEYLAVAPFSMRDFERQARSTLSEARREAERILAQAYEKADQIRSGARETALAEGLAEGRERGRREAREQAAKQALEESRAAIHSLVETITSIATRFDERKLRLLAEAERGVIELAVRIADRVCRMRAAEGADVAVAQVRELLELAQDRHDALIRISPADDKAIRRVVADLATRIDELKHVAIEVDPTMQAGDCALVSREGAIDARLQTRIDRVAAALIGAAVTDADEAPDVG